MGRRLNVLLWLVIKRWDKSRSTEERFRTAALRNGVD